MHITWCITAHHSPPSGFRRTVPTRKSRITPILKFPLMKIPPLLFLDRRLPQTEPAVKQRGFVTRADAKLVWWFTLEWLVLVLLRIWGPHSSRSNSVQLSRAALSNLSNAQTLNCAGFSITNTHPHEDPQAEDSDLNVRAHLITLSHARAHINPSCKTPSLSHTDSDCCCGGPRIIIWFRAHATSKTPWHPPTHALTEIRRSARMPDADLLETHHWTGRDPRRGAPAGGEAGGRVWVLPISSRSSFFSLAAAGSPALPNPSFCCYINPSRLFFKVLSPPCRSAWLNKAEGGGKKESSPLSSFLC